MENAASTPAPTATRPPLWVAGVVVLGALVSPAVGLAAGRTDTASYSGCFNLFFEDTIHIVTNVDTSF